MNKINKLNKESMKDTNKSNNFYWTRYNQNDIYPKNHIIINNNFNITQNRYLPNSKIKSGILSSSNTRDRISNNNIDILKYLKKNNNIFNSKRSKFKYSNKEKYNSVIKNIDNNHLKNNNNITYHRITANKLKENYKKEYNRNSNIKINIRNNYSINKNNSFINHKDGRNSSNIINLNNNNVLYNNQNKILNINKTSKEKNIYDKLKLNNNIIQNTYEKNKKNGLINKNSKHILNNDRENGENEKEINFENYVCPKCQRKGIIEINQDYSTIKIRCIKDHYTEIKIKDLNIKLNDTIKCYICRNNNLKLKDLYYCSCKKVVCQNCKKNGHHNNHDAIPFIENFYFCFQHKQKFEQFCEKCKKNICKDCLDEHNDHKKEIKYYTELLH